MQLYSILPHENKELWKKSKEQFKIMPKNINELNGIFYKGKSKFFNEIDKYHKKEGEEFLKVYKNLSSLALDLENIFKGTAIPLLKEKTNDEIEYSRKEVALIFLLSFFNLINIEQEKGRKTNNFRVYQVLSSSQGTEFQFGRCFLNYLTVIGKWLSEKNPILDEKIKYIRRNKKFDYHNFKEDIKLCKIEIKEKGSLFGSKSSYYMDFANMFIGGGVLERGCVQEEILFAVHPEAIVAMFFMEVMNDNDAIRIDQIIQYSNYIGYGRNFKYKESAINNGEIKKIKIIAIDAVIQHTGFDGTIDQKEIKRDINKAFVGFDLVNCSNEKNEEKSISTGNWGCGAFNGDHELKFLQQWVAASYAGIERLDYHTYEDKNMLNIIDKIDQLKNKYKNANKLYNDLVNKPLKNGKVVKILLSKKNNENDDCLII